MQSMQKTAVEQIFQILDDTAILLKNELDCTYLEALAETGENLYHDQVLQEEVSEVNKKRLVKNYEEAKRIKYTKEDMRKAFQLACLKGMRENIQPNHQMTPDTIGIFMSYLIGKFMKDRKSFSLLDPAIGSANLMTTILNQLQSFTIDSIGIDIDDVLIHLAYVNANLVEQPIQLFNQDSLENLYVDPVDVVVSDLPVGYYPNDVRASEFALKADSGHSYAHHLMIEQSCHYTKEGGYLFFIVPNGLFESSEAPKLNKFIKEHLYIQAFIHLPESMFKNKNLAKSILVLQKKGADIKSPKEVLLASMPSLTNKQHLQSFFNKLNDWVQENK